MKKYSDEKTEYQLPKLSDELKRATTERERAYLDYINNLLLRLQRDFSTGLLHKQEFKRRQQEAPGPGVYIFIDGDGLKKLNDQTQDHAAGDAAIRALGKAIQKSLRDSEADISRHGGDEFVIFVKNVSLSVGVVVAKRILNNIHQQNIADFYNGNNESVRQTLQSWPLKASLGVGLSEEEADAAMYKAKATGRDRVEFAKGKQAATHIKLLKLALRLKQSNKTALSAKIVAAIKE